MDFATKTDAVASMLQKTEKINKPVRMLVWIDSGCSLTSQDL